MESIDNLHSKVDNLESKLDQVKNAGDRGPNTIGRELNGFTKGVEGIRSELKRIPDPNIEGRKELEDRLHTLETKINTL